MAALPADENPRALGLRVFHVTFDSLDLGGEGQRPDVDAPGSGGRSLTDGLHVLNHLGDELVVHGRLDVAALDRYARLRG